MIKKTPSNFLRNDLLQKEPTTNLHEKVIDFCKANLQNHIAVDAIEWLSITQIYEELNQCRNKKIRKQVLFQPAGVLSPESTKSSQTATVTTNKEQGLSKKKTTRVPLEKCSIERKTDIDKKT